MNKFIFVKSEHSYLNKTNSLGYNSWILDLVSVLKIYFFLFKYNYIFEERTWFIKHQIAWVALGIRKALCHKLLLSSSKARD